MGETQQRHAKFSFGYSRHADQDAASPVRHPVVVVGAGPVGLAAGIDLGQRGIPVVILDDADRIGEGSRGLCYSKRCLEVLDTIGAGEAVADKGVDWKVGKVHFKDREVYEFDLLPEPGHKMPAFVNLQQYYLEKYLVERVEDLDNVTVRWRNKVTGVAQAGDGVSIEIETPDGPYTLQADWLIAADGANSPILRTPDGYGEQSASGFAISFLIADVKSWRPAFPAGAAGSPSSPSYHPGQSTLLHKSAGQCLAAWISSSAGMPTRRRRRSRKTYCARVDRPCSARTALGRTRVAVSVYTFQLSSHERAFPVTAVCCLSATPPTRCRRSARAAPIPASRTATTSPGSLPWS